MVSSLLYNLFLSLYSQVSYDRKPQRKKEENEYTHQQKQYIIP